MKTILRPVFEAIRIAGRYLIARLLAHEEVADKAPAVQGALDNVVRAHEALESARDARVGVLAIRDHCRALLAAVIRAFGQAARERTHSDYRSALYVEYFPEGTSKLNRSRIDVFVVKVGVLLVKLDKEADPTLKAYAERITEALRPLEEAVAKLRDAVAAEKAAAALYDTARSEWVATYREVYNALRVHFRRNPRLAEDFFLSHTKIRKAASGATDDIDAEPDEDSTDTTTEEAAAAAAGTEKAAASVPVVIAPAARAAA